MRLCCHACVPDGGGGSYDIVNNAVIPTPGPQNHRAQNVSLRQSWEMNYQEAAIYLQVFMWLLLLIERTLLLDLLVLSHGYVMLSITPSTLERLWMVKHREHLYGYVYIMTDCCM